MKQQLDLGQREKGQIVTDRNLVKRFQEAFKDPEKVKAEEYQKIIEANASKAAENAERLTFLLLSLGMLFMLSIQGGINKIDLGVVEIDDLSIILITLPVLIGYTHYDLVTTLSKFDRLSIIYKVIIEKRHRPIYNQRLSEYFLITPSLFEYKYLSTSGFAHRLQSFLWVFQFLTITILIPLGFQIYAFWHLVTLNNLVIPLVIMSLTVSFFFGLQSFLTTLALLKEVNEN